MTTTTIYDQAADIMARRLRNGMQSGRQHIRVLFSTDGDHIRPTRRRFLEVATASGIDDRQHTPTATAAHTTRYDLQAGKYILLFGNQNFEVQIVIMIK